MREWLEARARYSDPGDTEVHADVDIHVSMPPPEPPEGSSPLPQFAMEDPSEATVVGTSLFPDEITTVPPDAVSMPPDVIGLSDSPPALEVEDPVRIPPPP